MHSPGSHIGIGDAFGDTGFTFLGMVAADRMPAQIRVNTALRSTFFTMVLLSSVMDPLVGILIYLLLDLGLL